MIEQFWDDIIVYSVEYTVLNSDNTLKLYQKRLAIRGLISEKELENTVRKNIKNIVEIISIDEIVDALCLKRIYSNNQI